MATYDDDDDDEDDKTVIISSPVRVRPPQGRLVCVDPSVLEGGTGGEIRLVYDEVSVGSGAGNMAVVKAEGVEGSHALIIPGDVAWGIEASAGAVLINGARIEGRTWLKMRDKVRIGAAEYTVELYPPGMEPGAPAAAAKSPADAAPGAGATPASARQPKPAPVEPAAPKAAAPKPPPPAPASGGSSSAVIVAVVVVIVIIAVVAFVL